MNEQERAEEHLRTIRRLMERGTIYRAISAPTALVGGLLALVAGAVYSPGWTFHQLNGFLLIWVVVLLLTAGANTLFIFLGAQKRGEQVFSPSMKTALCAIAPAFILGGILTALFLVEVEDTAADLLICALWIVLYGMGLLATSPFAPRSLVILGLAFFTSGLFVIVTAFVAQDPAGMSQGHIPSYLMAATFGLYHLIYAACVWPRKNSEP